MAKSRKVFIIDHVFPRSIGGSLLFILVVIFIPILLVQAILFDLRFESRRAQELAANLDTARAVAVAFEAYVRDVLRQELALGLALTSPPIPPEEQSRHLAISAGTYPSLREFSWLNPQGRVEASSNRRDVHFRINASPIRDEQGKIVGAVEVARNVTELVELDEFKDEFIFVAAHELKTPVAIMKGYAQALLRAKEALSAPSRRLLQAVDRGADRIHRIVKDLLDISQLHLGTLALQKERVDLTDMVQEVVDRIAPTITKHHVRIVRLEPVVVEGDRERLEQVLDSLLDNAIKYSPRGGDIDVAVELTDQEAVVSVKDYGVGIPKEKQAHIFERFYRAHTGTPYDYGGMGVGLYISKEIVSRHGGRMWFESEEGRGSTFYFGLPLKGEDAER